MTTKIKIIIPDRKTGGIYDFSCRLAEQIEKARTVEIVPLSKENRVAQHLSRSDIVFLQYSGYGYDSRGAPIWMLDEFLEIKKRVRVCAVYFHELYAQGKPWQSSFWLSPIQKLVAARLACAADFWISNRELSSNWLKHWSPSTPNTTLPVFSTVGVAPYSSNKSRSIVIFGSRSLRERTYRKAGEGMFSWAVQNNFTIEDVGEIVQDSAVIKEMSEYGVVQHGMLPKSEVVNILARSSIGVIAYPRTFLSKSSVFASYCAHSVCPIILARNRAVTDGLYEGRQYLSEFPNTFQSWDIAHVGFQARQWYQAHTQERHVEAFMSFVSATDISSRNVI